ncbi:hypothetical protein ACYATL_07530 [Actinotignum timonense]|uniref:hypothetical protein n=1 Tax=Actinotignum TaxID=1653174 RepID=UPI00254E652A|nr:hypothetical protein [Actinotignum timonense]MDK6907358.1 hypothetical protein [Actinotignum timonense]MDK8534696.1 hypothetical protein [Gleimia europaea]
MTALGTSVMSVVSSWAIALAPLNGFWGGVANVQLEGGGDVVIGMWYMSDPNDAAAPEVVDFDIDNPPTEPIKKGSIVVVKKNGEVVGVFTALHTIDPANPDFNPLDPNERWVRPMVYSENTAEYRHFHHYHNHDYVIFEGRTYQYAWGVAHNPNTVSERPPSAGEPYWVKVSDAPIQDLWFRHRIYLRGAEVIYKGVRYRCELDGRAGFQPDHPNNGWTRLE